MKSLLIVIVACAAIASAQNNCPGASGSPGVNCTDPTLCCGFQTIYPQCLPADGSKKCCTHYKGATQCNPDEVCGGGGGAGASSYATCGPPGSTFCDKGTGTGAYCNATLPTCCGTYGTYGFCCAPGCACNNSYYKCECPEATTASPTTPDPTTPAPTTPPPPMNNCPGAAGTAGVNCSSSTLCCGYGSMSPSCLAPGKRCCSRYLAATQCDSDQVCGGGGGPGASSYATCGPPGTTYCDQGTGQGAFCNATQPTCCGNYGVLGFCCAPGCTCNNSQYTCSCPSPTTAKPTVKPTVKPTPKPKTCKTAGPRGQPASCPVGGKCCGAPNTNAFCCGPRQKCNNKNRTCTN